MRIALSVPEEENKTGPESPYFQAMISAGARPDELELVSPSDFEGVSTLPYDGLLLSGGADVDPAFYDQQVRYDSVRTDHRRDEFELQLLQIALYRKLPVLAICRGMQLLNVKFGGTLYQDLQLDAPAPENEALSIEHRLRTARAETTHSVTLTDPESMLAAIFRGSWLVNSEHHQGIKSIARGLKATAHAEDGLIEAIELANGDSYVVGVQWHPEEMVARPEQLKLFEQFLEQCRAVAARLRRPPEKTVLPAASRSTSGQNKQA